MSASTSTLGGFFSRARRAPRPSAPQPAAGGRRWLRALGYVSFFLFSFVVFVYLTFPYDRVRDFVVHQVELAIPGAELEIVSLEPAWLTGIEAHGVRFRLPADEPARAGAEPEARRPPRPSVTLPYVYARASILSYLLGTTEVVFEVQVDGGGTLEGVVRDDGAQSHVTAHLENVDLRRIGVIRHYTGFSVTGVVSGDVDLTVAEDTDATDGTLALSIAGASLGDEQFQVPLPGMGSGLQLTRVEAGDLSLRIVVENGQGRVEQFSGDGADVVLRGAGTVRLVRPFRASSIDLLVRAAIQPAYLQRNPAVQGALELAGSNPLVAPYRAPDGAFQVRLQGNFGGRVTALAAGSATIPQ
jgi:type II secretion system protein N